MKVFVLNRILTWDDLAECECMEETQLVGLFAQYADAVAAGERKLASELASLAAFDLEPLPNEARFYTINAMEVE